MSTRTTLPDKPSELIRVALCDMLACFKDKRNYRIVMHDWHMGQEGQARCEVCLAGSVMAKTFKVDKHIDECPGTMSDASDEDISKLEALDEFRNGNVLEGLQMMGAQASAWFKKYGIGRVKINKCGLCDPNEEDVEAFRASMCGLIKKLEAIGL